VCAGLLAACGHSDTCRPTGQLPISVTVVDAATGNEICDALVTIANAGVEERLTACPYVGGNGLGTFEVSVERAGYATKTEAVTIKSPVNGCQDVEPVTVALEPAPTS
jgi:hypothetical protein